MTQKLNSICLTHMIDSFVRENNESPSTPISYYVKIEIMRDCKPFACQLNILLQNISKKKTYTGAIQNIFILPDNNFGSNYSSRPRIYYRRLTILFQGNSFQHTW